MRMSGQTRRVEGHDRFSSICRPILKASLLWFLHLPFQKPGHLHIKPDQKDISETGGGHQEQRSSFKPVEFLDHLKMAKQIAGPNLLQMSLKVVNFYVGPATVALNSVKGSVFVHQRGGALEAKPPLTHAGAGRPKEAETICHRSKEGMLPANERGVPCRLPVQHVWGCRPLLSPFFRKWVGYPSLKSSMYRFAPMLTYLEILLWVFKGKPQETTHALFVFCGGSLQKDTAVW